MKVCVLCKNCKITVHNTIIHLFLQSFCNQKQNNQIMASTTMDSKILLPPKILGRQACSECHRYLSVGPVVVTRRGRTICGRCNINSLYDQIAKNCIFPCSNYNTGCLELLLYNEAKNHETNCSKNAVISCPFCKYEGDEHQLVQHFKGEHSEYVVDSIFELTPKDGYSRNLIFLKDEHILCITVIMRGKFLNIYNTLLTPSFSKFTRFMLNFFKFGDDSHFITFQIQITRNSINFPVNTDTNYEEVEGDDNHVQLENCFLIAHEYLTNCLRSNSYYCRMDYVDNKDWGLEMAQRKLNVPRDDEKLVASKLEPPKNCSKENLLSCVDYVLNADTAALRQLAKNRLIESPKCGRCERCIIDRDYGFVCPKEHVICQWCVSEKCPECKTFVQWNCLYKNHNILLKCEWNCKEEINIYNYRRHVHLCSARWYKCPDKNCSYAGLLDDFKKHWHLNTYYYGNGLWLNSKEQAFYWLLPDYQDLVYVTFEMISDDQCLVTVHEDDALCSEDYTFELTRCTVEQDWAPLKSGIGKCQTVKFQGSGFQLFVNSS